MNDSNYRHCSVTTEDSNIEALRARYPDGLTFVVGDTHGEYATLQALMDKIQFNPAADHVYFVGDYNGGGSPGLLLQYLSQYYQQDPENPGFHLIRGNHERELWPQYPLKNLPDIIVIKAKTMDYFISHAGMMAHVHQLICDDIKDAGEGAVFQYRLDDNAVAYDAPLRQIIWSRNGLYSQKSHYHCWPSEDALRETKTCIIHGHTPYFFLKRGQYFAYGDRNIFWENQRVWFSEDLQSFNIDSNIKGRADFSNTYRGLSCICLEALEEIASAYGGSLTIDGLLSAADAVFGVPYIYSFSEMSESATARILTAEPVMKTIAADSNGAPYFL